ncbi:carcinoembryonic antigen-related cell adhesion molecule 3-like [Carassius carassius]|uniref:carcinoembryonic antigen-related cell adhesion molecule 3-like n=1 Tax=Carassius carassius TaxID=217509 RepID=UPI0028691021|nr:carcinoembryonic antigen-related cell adhesion molecule 3-like [Carassius carassius]
MTASVLITLCASFVAGVSGVYTDGVSVSVNEGESVTLYTDVTTVQQEKISWYFNDIKLAEITGGQSKICTDVQCDGRFRSRLILDYKNGSLTIKDTRPKDTGVYKLKITKNSRDLEKIFFVTVHGFFSTDTEEESVFVMEGDSVTLHTDVKTDQQEKIRWYYYDTRIAQITGDLSNSCTDVQCNEGAERLRDRLKLDHQTGSLTIMNTRDPASGLYRLRIISSDTITEKIFFVAVYGVSAAERDEMKRKSVKEGESVTLDTRVIKKTTDAIRWYFNDSLIAEITGDQSKICSDVQCKERFRDRLKLDHQTGSLTITNTRTTDSGDYKLQIRSSRFSITRSFSVAVISVSAAERDEMKRKSVKEGESVTLDTYVIKKPTDVMRWYFNDSLIAEITGDQSKICSDVQCKERFRDRLKVNQTGSLTITNTRTTDSGEYKLQISSSRFSIMRSFTLTVSDVSDSGSSSVAVAVVVVVLLLLLLFVAAVVFYKRQAIMQCIRRQRERLERREQRDDAQEARPEQIETLMQRPSTGTSQETEAAGDTEAADQSQL